MSRKKTSTKAPEAEELAERPTSSLPEKFEVFEESMKSAEEPAPEPEPEPEKKEEGPFVSMEETTWSGLKMWRCPKCSATTFKRVEAETHTCKRTKWADEAEA